MHKAQFPAPLEGSAHQPSVSFSFMSIVLVLEFELLETLPTVGFMECPWKGWASNDKGYFSFSVDKPREGHFLGPWGQQAPQKGWPRVPACRGQVVATPISSLPGGASGLAWPWVALSAHPRFSRIQRQTHLTPQPGRKLHSVISTTQKRKQVTGPRSHGPSMPAPKAWSPALIP